MPSPSVPILRDVDVLVVGSSSTAVAISLEIKRAGRSVMLASDLPYVGSDLAGTFRLWPADWMHADPLLCAAYAESPSLPARPGIIKRALEEALLKAEIPFLFLSRPVAILRDEVGRVEGVVLAARTALIGVACRSIVDATDHGLIARLEGLPMQSRSQTGSITEWTILAKKTPANWPGSVTEIEPSFVQQQQEGMISYHAYRLGIESTALGSEPKAAEHIARSLLIDENVVATADLLVTPPTEELHRVSRNPCEPQVAPGIWMLNRLLPFSTQEPDQALAFARKLGAEVAALTIPRPAEIAFYTGPACQSAAFHFAPTFLRSPVGSFPLPSWDFPVLGTYDILVAGGGTGGAPAGIAAARAGAKTLVIEAQHGFGGVGTIGLISAYWFGNRIGFTEELDREVSRWDSWSRAKNGDGWNPEVKSRVYHRMLREAGGDAWLGAFAFGVKMNGEKVEGVLVSTPFGSGLVRVGSVVDASGNADLAAAAGAPCRMVGADHVAVQGAGLSPKVHPAAHYQNSDHTFIDETDPEGITSAFVQARAKYPNDFDTASIPGTRERRQIVAEIEISPLDILAGRTFPDTAYVARSNFDTHGFTIHPVFMMAAPDHEPIQAYVPFRCMLPRGVEGLLVTGLGMGAHRDALPLLRMQADVQNQGYAAGLAAAEAAKNGVDFRHLNIRALQSQLAAKGILTPEILQHEDSFPMPPESLQKALDGELGSLTNIAILLAHSEETRSPLLQILASDSTPQRRNGAARLLGMMGERLAAPALEALVRETPWDEGWNYRGMGQFGSSMSWLDSVIIALGKTRDPMGIPAMESKILALNEDSVFSHCRAVALAAALLPDPRLANALERLLEAPGMRGHALTNVNLLQAHANGDRTETDPRNRSLRELYLAMGLFLTGDPNGTGREILDAYTQDLRGHFARYAQALLAECDLDALRTRLA